MPIALSAILAEPDPPAYAREKTLSLWTTVQAKIAELNDVSSHAAEGVSYSRDLQRAEQLLREYFTAYRTSLATDGARAGTNPHLLQQPRGHTYDWRNLKFDQL